MEALNRHGGDFRALDQYRIVLGPIAPPEGEGDEPLVLRLPEGVR